MTVNSRQTGGREAEGLGPGGPWRCTVQRIIAARRESQEVSRTLLQDNMIRDQKVASLLLTWTHVRSSERPPRSSASDERWSAR